MPADCVHRQSFPDNRLFVLTPAQGAEKPLPGGGVSLRRRPEASSSVAMLSGCTRWVVSHFLRSFSAAFLLRRSWTSTSKTSPSSSMARQRHIFCPPTRTRSHPEANDPSTDIAANAGLPRSGDPTSALSRQLLDIPIAKRGPAVEPNDIPDHLRGEPVALVRNGLTGDPIVATMPYLETSWRSPDSAISHQC